MEQALLALFGALTTLLSGDRIYQTLRTRRQDSNENAPISKADLTPICTELSAVSIKLETLNNRMERHLGYHEGAKEER